MEHPGARHTCLGPNLAVTCADPFCLKLRNDPPAILVASEGCDQGSLDGGKLRDDGETCARRASAHARHGVRAYSRIGVGVGRQAEVVCYEERAGRDDPQRTVGGCACRVLGVATKTSHGSRERREPACTTSRRR